MLPLILLGTAYLISRTTKSVDEFADGGETKYHIKVSESLSQKSMNEILKIQLKKLEDYKQKGYTKERLVELNKFSKSWLDKHYEDGGVVNAKNQEFLKRFISTKISSDKEKFIMKYLKDIDIDIKTTPYKILKSFVKQANRYYESEMVKTLPYKKYEIRYQIPFGAKYSTEIIARTPNEARKDFLSYNRGDKIISVTLSKNKIKIADGTNTTFDGGNPDIRYEGGGESDTIRIDGKEATIDELYEVVRDENFSYRTFNLNPKKIEYNGNDEQIIREIKNYNRLTNPYNFKGELQEHYMKAIIQDAFNKVSFRKFGDAYRKNIDKIFKAERFAETLRGRYTFKEYASYIIGDGTFYVDEKGFRSFAKDLGIPIPPNISK